MVKYVAIKHVVVAKGFSQIFGKDFYETYSPTTRLSTIRILMCIAISNNYQLKQMDIKTAYLNAPIEEDVVIKQPEGFKFWMKMENPLFVN